MSEYTRTARESSINQLHPELRNAIRKYFREHDLGDLQTETLRCCEILSRKKQEAGWISWLSRTPDTTIYTGMLLTSHWLVWAHYGDQSGIRLNAANLNKIGAQYKPPVFLKDAGLEIVGYIGDANARVHGYVAMGTDVVAQKFCEEVQKAIVKANPRPPKNIFQRPAG